MKFKNLLALLSLKILHSAVWSSCSYSTDFLASSRGSVSSQTHFSISHSTDNTRPACSPDLTVPAYCLWAYVKSIKNTSCQVGGLNQHIQEHSQGIPKEMLQHVVMRTTCHIQTVKINMNCRQHEVPSVNKMFSLCLRMVFHCKIHIVFLMHPIQYSYILAGNVSK